MSDTRVAEIEKIVAGLRRVKVIQDKGRRKLMGKSEELLIEVWDEFRQLRGHR